MTQKVVVIDYGVGNLYSVCNALSRVGACPVLTNDPKALTQADRVILPGVGAFSTAMANLRTTGFEDSVKNFVNTGRPFLGICVGMQLLMEHSSELGSHQGLSLISGNVEKLAFCHNSAPKIRIPHIGWASVKINGTESKASQYKTVLFPDDEYYYFVHSYACRPLFKGDGLATCDYGGQKIIAAIGRGNIIGVQFHPERSGQAGLSFLQRFLTI